MKHSLTRVQLETQLHTAFQTFHIFCTVKNAMSLYFWDFMSNLDPNQSFYSPENCGFFCFSPRFCFSIHASLQEVRQKVTRSLRVSGALRVLHRQTQTTSVWNTVLSGCFSLTKSLKLDSNWVSFTQGDGVMQLLLGCQSCLNVLYNVEITAGDIFSAVKIIFPNADFFCFGVTLIVNRFRASNKIQHRQLE